jgi:outer membrane protein insertion porin family
MFRNIIFIFYLLFFLLANTISVFSQIKVKGNKKISSDTIIGYFSSKKDLTSLSAVELNDIQKKLFETGFFKNIQISKDNDIILVSIEENPLINFFNIEGIDNKSILSILEKNITNKENTFFSEYKLKQDIEIINSLLKNSGYFNSEISSSITLISDNRVNIFYNVKLNSLTRISRIFFIGDKVYKNSTLLNVVESEEHGWWKFFGNSSVLSANRIDYDVNLLKNFYLNNGYYDVQISSSSIDIFDKYKANLTYSINSGELYNFGSVNFLDSVKSINSDS